MVLTEKHFVRIVFDSRVKRKRIIVKKMVKDKIILEIVAI